MERKVAHPSVDHRRALTRLRGVAVMIFLGGGQPFACMDLLQQMNQIVSTLLVRNSAEQGSV